MGFDHKLVKIALVISLIGGGFAWIISSSLNVPVPSQTSFGIVQSHVFAAAHTEFRGSKAVTPIKIDARYFIQIQLDNGETVKSTWPASQIEQMPIGQRVQVTYHSRKLPLLEKKNYLEDLKIIYK